MDALERAFRIPARLDFLKSIFEERELVVIAPAGDGIMIVGCDFYCRLDGFLSRKYFYFAHTLSLGSVAFRMS
jgi:hypothetical protein